MNYSSIITNQHTFKYKQTHTADGDGKAQGMYIIWFVGGSLHFVPQNIYSKDIFSNVVITLLSTFVPQTLLRW